MKLTTANYLKKTQHLIGTNGLALNLQPKRKDGMGWVVLPRWRGGKLTFNLITGMDMTREQAAEFVGRAPMFA